MVFFPKKLKLEEFINLCLTQEKINLKNEAWAKIAQIRKKIETLLGENQPIYGFNTGFGGLSDKFISFGKLKKLQKNLILSHACGTGKPLKSIISRGALLLLIKSLSSGYSGITPKTLEALIKIYNAGVIPYIPEKGSLGASGDLAPLAHLALILLGRGKAFYKNKVINGKEVLKVVGLQPLNLEPKEGLALINGTHVMTSLLAFGVRQALILSQTADINTALSLSALKSNLVFLHPKIHNLKPFAGQIKTAKNLRRLLKDIKFPTSSEKKQIQEAYSLRCVPQVHGASKEAINYAKKTVEIEINSITDNPLFIDGQFLSGGNFHGQALAMAADFLAIAVSELANIAERRIDRLINPHLRSSLPPFLIKDSGLNSGLMVAQYTAAALVSQNKVLCHPAVIDSIPTSAQQEDHVSMGMTSCLKLQEVLENTEKVLAIEMMAACQAIDLQNDLKLNLVLNSIHRFLRKSVSFLNSDRELSIDIAKIANLINQEKFIEIVKKSIGKLET